MIPTTSSGRPSMSEIMGRFHVPCYRPMDPRSPPEQRPGGSAGVRLKPDLHRGLQGIGIAPIIIHHDAMTPGALDPEIDKRHRAPDQVEMRKAELLVVRAPTAGLHQGGDIVVVHAEIDIRAQLVGPPMLVVDAGR